MGTQPNRKLAKRGSKIRSRALRNNLKNTVNSGDYQKASSYITKAVRKSGGANFLSGALAAGIIAYAEAKTRKSASSRNIAGNAISKIPKDLRNNLTLAGKDSIRSALTDTLSKRRAR